MNMANFTYEELQGALEETLSSIDTEFEEGRLTEEEAAGLEEDALAEYQDLEAELLAEEGMEDPAEYAVYDGVLANFSAATELGGLLQEYIVAQDPEDPETTIADLAYSLGLIDEDGNELDEEEAIAGLLGVMSGEITPDESLIEGIVDYFELDDEETDEIYDLAEAELTEDEDGEEYEDEYIDPNTELLENEIENLEGELEEVGGLAEEAFSRVASMEANFAYAQEQQNIAREFENLEREAYALVENGQMPPAIFDEHYGNFQSREDQLAAFSQVCESRRVEPETELYRLEGLNETYADMEPNISFSQFSYSDPQTSDFEQDDALLAQAARNVRNRLNNNNFGQPLNLNGVGVGNTPVSSIPSQQLGSVNPTMTPLATTSSGYSRTF